MSELLLGAVIVCGLGAVVAGLWGLRWAILRYPVPFLIVLVLALILGMFWAVGRFASLFLAQPRP